MNNQERGNIRWTVVALLFFATTINYIDRQILSLIKPILDDELGWTNTEFGLVNSAFQGAYGLSLLFFGWFVDRFGAKIGYAVSITFWSLAAMLHAAAGTLSGFAAARTALGLGEGGNFPAAIKSVTQWFPKSERAFATSIFNAGTNAGAIIAPAIVPVIALTWGWQWAFIGAGLLGLIWLFFWLPWFESPEKKRLSSQELNHIKSGQEEDELTKVTLPWTGLLKYRQTWAFIVPKFLTDPVWWFFLIWLPDFFNKRGLEIKSSWVHLVSIYTIVTILSIAGGWLTGYLMKKGWSVNKARKTGMLIFATCAVPILFVTSLSNWEVVILIGLAGAAHQAWSANLYTTVSDMFPATAVASVIGIGGMAGAIGGMLFPPFVGYIIDQNTTAGNADPAYSIIFTICAFAYLLSWGIMYVLTPDMRKVRE
jgi:ACS family hexuronate transporter-like MFS transporter